MSPVSELVVDLRKWGKLKIGDPFPEKNWGEVVSDLLNQAADMIGHLQYSLNYYQEDLVSEARTFAIRAANLVSGDRNTSHGEMLANHQKIAAVWNGVLQAAGKLGQPLDAHDVANLMEALKIARRYNGSFNADDYVDGAGYAAVAGEIAMKMGLDNGGQRR